MSYIFIALAPVFIILFYIYFRDKYDKEPIKLLLKALLVGAVIVIPVIFFEQLMTSLMGDLQGIPKAAYTAFLVAALIEELFKFLGLYLLVWRNKAFDERFDGIVYAVFISLGFAAVENIMYVYEGGMSVGYMRAFTAVPAHAIFGVAMGYYFGRARFNPEKRGLFLSLSLLVPILIHGLYDFILMTGIAWLLIFFVALMVFMYIYAFKRMKDLISISRFKND